MPDRARYDLRASSVNKSAHLSPCQRQDPAFIQTMPGKDHLFLTKGRRIRPKPPAILKELRWGLVRILALVSVSLHRIRTARLS